MLARILQNLSIYLGSEYNQTLLTVIVNKVIAQIKMYRNYPDTYTETQIENDLEKYESKIFDIALATYNRMGIEGEYKHNENNVGIELVSEEKLYDFVIPLARSV